MSNLDFSHQPPASPVTSTWSQARDSQKIYKVAILPFLIHSQENLDYLRDGIYDILASRITVEGRITVIDRSTVERALYEERPMRLDEASAAKIGMRVGADYIVLGSITKVGDYISLDARLISITEDKPPLGVFTQTKGIDDVMVKIGDFAQDIGNKILGRRAVAGTGCRTRQNLPISRETERGSIPKASKRARPSTSRSKVSISEMSMETRRMNWSSWIITISISLGTMERN